MDKPFKTIAEQVDILKSRGLSVGANAYSILEREGYYSVINGYKDPFLLCSSDGHPCKDRFTPGTTFNDIYKLFSFDRALRVTMFPNFARAEATLKTVCSYNFAEQYCTVENAYLKQESYSNEEDLQKDISKIIKTFKNIIGYQKDGNIRTKRQYIIHYITKHDNVPIWVLANYLSLGQIFKFYCFQKESVRNKIAKSFSEMYGKTHKNQIKISPRRLRLAFDHIKDFRNICAHDERLYCARVSPSKDTNLLGVLRDLALVLPQETTERMLKAITDLMLMLDKDIKADYSRKIFAAMGIPNIKMLASIAES